MTIHVHGYAAQQAKTSLGPYSFERREPCDYDIVIDIGYCGICHTDIHQVGDEWGGSTFPMVPGHEITGIVSQVGPKVTRYKIGDRVGVGCFVNSCRKCEPCRKNLEQYCTEGMTTTYNGIERDGTPTQGGYSNKIVVDENYVLSIPDNLPLDKAAPLLCAGITLYSPLMHWKAGPGKKVAIIGLGGIGHMGVKLAHALGAEVTVLSHSLKKQEDGKKLGADYFYATSDPKTFEKLKGYFDLIINTVSAELDWNQYLELLTLDGAMVVVGIPEKQTSIGSFPLVAGRRSLAGSLIGGIKETQEMLDFCSKNNIASEIELVPIQKVNEAYKRILNSDVRYRFVIDIKSLEQK
ncbi:MAG: NAD(P)-dependent alcohol dehydrogenase [Thaumarchaeota archaeon]|nr:NAD(P)-dependent alcohol dehydrogenase [Nitrososphaerota archaeon]MDE1867081.1 NAD(P)-dependent alcohol dehydrogenase [Nitrososphaerota archaeon]